MCAAHALADVGETEILAVVHNTGTVVMLCHCTGVQATAAVSGRSQSSTISTAGGSQLCEGRE